MQIIRRRNTYPFTFESRNTMLMREENHRESRREIRRENRQENCREIRREIQSRVEMPQEEIRREENHQRGDAPLRQNPPFNRRERERKRRGMSNSIQNRFCPHEFSSVTFPARHVSP
ncbi:hypothetical protein HID58_045518 [Brassica napus]|uniref:Uncharacterized protein n=1 Tax=Brassica napus TaxID=3708 RepID=A0ABQ8ATR3_BRANA|nr:hypothetical protein HID58_045518 [Brassica napus]